jgi:hypothetical protein
MKVGQIAAMKDEADGIWVAEIVELLNVVWDENDQKDGNVVMHEYGSKAAGSGKKVSWKYPQHPMYTKGADLRWKYEIEVGKKVGSSFKPVLVHVWDESVVMWGSRREMLTKKSMLKKSVLDDLLE